MIHDLFTILVRCLQKIAFSLIHDRLKGHFTQSNTLHSLSHSRVLPIALLALSSVAFAQYSIPEYDTDCALYLHGPPKSSAFDYNLNLFRGTM